MIDHLVRPGPSQVLQDVESSVTDSNFDPQNVLDVFTEMPAPGNSLGEGEGDAEFSPGTTLDSFPHPSPGNQQGSGGHVESLLDLPRFEGGGLEGQEKTSEHSGALLDLPRFEESSPEPEGLDPEFLAENFHPDHYGDFEAVSDLIDEGAEHFVHEPDRFDFESESGDSEESPRSSDFSNLRAPDLRYDPGYDGAGPGSLGVGPGRFELADLDELRSRFAQEEPDDLLRELFGSPDLAAASGLGLDLFSPGDVLNAYHQPRAGEPEIGSAIGTLPRLETEVKPGPAAAEGQNPESSEFEDWLSAYDYFDPYADREERPTEPYGPGGEHFQQNEAPGPASGAAAGAEDESVDPGRVIDGFHGSGVDSAEDLSSAIERMPDLEASAEDHWRPVSTDLEHFLKMLGRPLRGR